MALGAYRYLWKTIFIDVRKPTKVLGENEMPSAHSELVHDKFAIIEYGEIKTKPCPHTISINP